MVEITVVEQNKEKRMKIIQDSPRGDNIKRTNIQIIGISEEEEKEKESEKMFEEIIVENFLNKGKKIVKSSKHKVPYRINPRKNTTKKLIKLSKIK